MIKLHNRIITLKLTRVQLRESKKLNDKLKACPWATENSDKEDCDEELEVVKLKILHLSNALKEMQLLAWQGRGFATGSAVQAGDAPALTAQSLASSAAPSPPTSQLASHLGDEPAVELAPEQSPDSTCNSPDLATLSEAGSSISRVKTEQEVELVKTLAAERAAFLKVTNRPIVLVLCDPTSLDILPGAVREISAVTTKLGEQAHVWMFSDVDQIEHYANKICDSELPTPAVVHVISHSNQHEDFFSGFDKGPLDVRLVSELVGPNTHVLLTCCFGMQKKGNFLAQGSGTRMAGRPASIFAFKSIVCDEDAIAVTKLFYQEFEKHIIAKEPTPLAKLVFDRGKREKLMFWEGCGIHAEQTQTRKFENAAWCWPPPEVPRAGPSTTYRGSKRTRDDIADIAFNLDEYQLSKSD
jgi:hypothetical protein